MIKIFHIHKTSVPEKGKTPFCPLWCSPISIKAKNKHIPLKLATEYTEVLAAMSD